MARKTALIAIALGFTFAAGIALAQGGLIPGRPDPELRAAQQSLVDAMAHLQKARNTGSLSNTRARAYIALAETELAEEPGGLQGLQN